jgi:hypothetical protein
MTENRKGGDGIAAIENSDSSSPPRLRGAPTMNTQLRSLGRGRRQKRAWCLVVSSLLGLSIALPDIVSPAPAAPAELSPLTRLWGAPKRTGPETEWVFPDGRTATLMTRGDKAVKLSVYGKDDRLWTAAEIDDALESVGWLSMLGAKLGCGLSTIVTGTHPHYYYFERGEWEFVPGRPAPTVGPLCSYPAFRWAQVTPYEIKSGVVDAFEHAVDPTFDSDVAVVGKDRVPVFYDDPKPRLHDVVRYAVYRSGRPKGLWPPRETWISTMFTLDKASIEQAVGRLDSNSVGEVDAYERTLEPRGGAAARLIEVGRPATALLLKSLADPTRAPAAYVLLCRIWGQPRDGCSAEIDEEDETPQPASRDDARPRRIVTVLHVGALTWRDYVDGRVVVDSASVSRAQAWWRGFLSSQAAGPPSSH